MKHKYPVPMLTADRLRQSEQYRRTHETYYWLMLENGVPPDKLNEFVDWYRSYDDFLHGLPTGDAPGVLPRGNPPTIDWRRR